MDKPVKHGLKEPRFAGSDEPDLIDSEEGRDSQHESRRRDGAELRNERRDERMHVRVDMSFDVNIGGRRYAGHDISVSGLSTVKRPPLDANQTARCEIAIRCNGFRATIPATVRMLGSRHEDRGGRFEITSIGEAEASILRKLVRSRLAGVHLTLDQLAANEDPQTVRDRVSKTVRPPNPAPSLVRFVGTLAVVAVLILALGAALYERLFVIEPNFAAVTAPEIKIYAPMDGELAAHEINPGDSVSRDQVLVQVQDPEVNAELSLARATLSYNERLIENLRDSLENAKGGKATVTTGGPADNTPPVMTELSPLEIRARIKEFETTYDFSKARIRALEARATAGTIYAPCDCIVHSIRSGDGGYWVQKGALIAQLIETGTENIKVEALVHLDKISGLEPNERAEVVMPTTGETLPARVSSIQLESQNIERAGFPEWARQDMSHGSVILAMESELPPSLVGQPVEVRFIDTDSAGGDVMAAVFGTLSDFFHGIIDPVTSALAGDRDR